MSEGRRPGWAFAGLLIWAVGVQLNETVAAIGFGLTSVWAISDATLSLSASGSDRRAVLTALRALWPLWLWIGWALLASALGHGFTGAGVARTLDWVGVATAAAAAAAIDGRQRRIVLVAALGVLVASSCVAGLQHFGVWPGPEWFAPLRWTKIGFGRVYEPVPGAEGRFMAGGLIFHRLKFAHVGSLAVLWALVYGLDLRGRPRAWALAAAGIGAVAILAFPYARAASAALLGAIAVTVLWHLENRRLAFGVVLAVMLAGAATIALRPSLRERFLLSGTAHGSGDRAELLESGLRAVRAHPWIGTGVGKFRPSAFPGPNTPQYVLDNPGKAHNQLLSIAAETGLVGLVLFANLLVALLRRFRARSTAAAAGLGSLAFFLLLGLAHDPLFQAEFSLGLVLSLGAALGVSASAAKAAGADVPAVVHAGERDP